MVVFVARDKLETHVLFQPILDTPVKWTSPPLVLPSGGLLYTMQGSDAPCRTVLLLKGNAGNADTVYELVSSMLTEARRVGLNVTLRVLEYRGFGAAVGSPSTGGVVQDAREAWDAMSPEERSTAVIMGVSLGGGVLGQLLLSSDICPAQAVFINTFSSLGEAASELTRISWIGSMITPWNTREGLKAYAARCPNARILIVNAKDDGLFSPQHANRLSECVTGHPNVQCIELPSGGHVGSVMQHFGLWAKHVIPCSPPSESVV